MVDGRVFLVPQKCENWPFFDRCPLKLLRSVKNVPNLQYFSVKFKQLILKITPHVPLNVGQLRHMFP